MLNQQFALHKTFKEERKYTFLNYQYPVEKLSCLVIYYYTRNAYQKHFLALFLHADTYIMTDFKITKCIFPKH